MSQISDFEETENPKEIVKRILESKANSTVIGIQSPALGRVMILTGVEDLILGEEPVVVLKPFDTSGNIISIAKIPLSQITSVKAFKTRFENPLISRLGNDSMSVAHS